MRFFVCCGRADGWKSGGSHSPVGIQNGRGSDQLSLDREKTVTEQINELVQLALKESDYITNNFPAWF